MAWLAGVSDFDLLGVMVSDALDEEVLVVVTMFCMKSSLNLTLPLLRWCSNAWLAWFSLGSVILAWIMRCFLRAGLLASVSLISID